ATRSWPMSSTCGPATNARHSIVRFLGRRWRTSLQMPRPATCRRWPWRERPSASGRSATARTASFGRSDGTTCAREGRVMGRILLVEDDVSLGQTLSERLEKDGHEVTWTRTLKAAAAAIDETRWSLAVLDVMLPDGSGLDVARAIRRRSATPMMIMTALNSATTRLEGFEIGADEYLPKPFHLREFLLRVRHVLSTQRTSEILRVEGREIDLGGLSVALADGTRSFLQVRDGQVLKLLINSAPNVVDRSSIL